MNAVTPIALFLLLQSCDSKEQKKSVPRPGLHRFTLTRLGADVAFDTQTGQICRTWDWKPVGAVTADVSGNLPERKAGEFAPTCLSLYEKFPSGNTSVQAEQAPTDGQ